MCRGIKSAFRRVTHQRPRCRRRRRVYFVPFRNNPENNGVDEIVTRPIHATLHTSRQPGEEAAAVPHQPARRRDRHHQASGP